MANMTAPMIPIFLEKQDAAQAWGFRLQGGTDYRLNLSVKKVLPNTPAHNRLHPGDVIVAIQGVDATALSHLQGNELIKSAGNSLNLMVRK